MTSPRALHHGRESDKCRVQTAGTRCYAYVLPAQTEGNVMRIPMLVLAAILASAAMLARAQTVIDVEGQKASPKVQDQSQGQPQHQTPSPQEDSQPSSQGRYSFSRVDNGFLRLDNESGQIAYCSPRPVGWACEAVAVDRAPLEIEIASVQKEVASLKKLDKEIVQLQDEVASLKTEIASLKE